MVNFPLLPPSATMVSRYQVESDINAITQLKVLRVLGAWAPLSRRPVPPEEDAAISLQFLGYNNPARLVRYATDEAVGMAEPPSCDQFDNLFCGGRP